MVSSADLHDNQALKKLLTEKDRGQDIYADSAYTGKACTERIQQAGMINQLHEKGYKNNPLSREQKENNKMKSKTRARIVHIFGMITKRGQHSMQLFTKSFARALVKIGMMNLGYNLTRAAYLRKVYGVAMPI
jgi:IS5 family transposase